MRVPYETLSDQARVFIYPGARKFFPDELPQLKQKIDDFYDSVGDTKMYIDLKYDRFLIFFVSDETPLDLDGQNQLVAFVQDLEKIFGLVLMDKVNVCFKQGQYVQMKEIPDFKKLIRNRGVSKKTLVFDHMINSKYEYESFWEVPAGKSWLAHFF